MFLSLKGSLNTKFPRFKGILDTYAGASAAYSLRRLSRVASSVVRVRRASDNSEKDFSATEVSSGTLVAWVGAGNDGFVETWYDQSGNGNDATQGTAGSQPKIVDAGVLVSGGIEFDGVDDRLTCSSLYSSDISVFNVVTTSNTVNTGNFMRMIHLCDGSDSFQLTRGGLPEIGKLMSKNTAFQSGTTAFKHGDINGVNLISAITSSTDTDAYIDGSLQSNSTDTLGFGNSATTTIGARDDLLSSSFFAGSHAELIIYNSDQSDNRTAIEANIGDHYGIDLPSGVDTGYDQVDGFVETWYDQSGNGNDAFQQVSGSQPKIVDGGTYLGDVHFDGSDDYLSSSDIGAYQSSDGVGFFCVYSKDTASTSDVFGSTNPKCLLQLRESALANSTFAARVLGGKLNVVRANETGSSFLTTTSNAHTIGTSLVLSSVTGTQAIDLFEDGSELSLQTDDSGLSYDSATTNLIIGSQDTGTRFLDGGINEMIIYKTDQSANHAAIEANINNQYDIY